MGLPENILLIRLKSIGDILFTLPAVHQVREAFPGARISYLVSWEYAPLLEGFREVDETFALNRARYRSGNPLHIVAETFSLFRRLRQGKYSLTVDFQGYGETAWLSRLSGAPQRCMVVAVMGALSATFGAWFTGLVEMTVGRVVSGAAPVVQLHA